MPRITGLGFSAFTIWSAEIVGSPASASPAVIDSAAVTAIVRRPNSLRKRIVVIPEGSKAQWQLDAPRTGRVQL
jgi:hypothetical protein